MTNVSSMLASIPAPPFDSIGPIRLYGLVIAIGVLAAVWLGRKRWAERGHDPEEISVIATWAVPAGLIGARLYHVITDYSTKFCGEPKCSGSLWPDMFNIRAGGLGIPGGIIAGVLVGMWRAKRMGVDTRSLADAVVPGIPLAQAIGRFGNYFNQELYGRRTDLPWGLSVDREYRPGGDQSLESALYHPTFLYEAIWNLGVLGLLLWLDSTKRLRRGALLWVYLISYSVGRLWVESLRIDSATTIGGWRVNTWMSLFGIAFGAAGLFVNSRRPADASVDDVLPALEGPTDDVSSTALSDGHGVDASASGMIADSGDVEESDGFYDADDGDEFESDAVTEVEEFPAETPDAETSTSEADNA